LPGGDPHFSDQHIFDQDFPLALDADSERATGWHGGKIQAPVAGSVGGGGCGVVEEYGGDFFSRVGFAPEVDGTRLLQDEVVAEKVRKAGIGKAADGQQENYESGQRQHCPA